MTTNNLLIISIIIVILFYIITQVELWLIFKKFNKKGILSLVPFCNTWILLNIGGLPGWLQFIPVANIIGLLVLPFMIAKKVNKTPLLGLIYLIAPNIYYLIIILAKEKKEKEIIEPNSQDNEQTPQVPKQEEFIEQPPLNLEEEKITETTPINNAYVNIKNEEQSNKIIDEDITNIFEQPLTIPEKQTIKEIDTLDTLTELKIEDINKPINSGEPLIPTLEELMPVQKEPLETIDQDMIEETVELPKMVNEEINEGIIATKRCTNCGFENTYSSKTCTVCGEQLN